MLLHEWNWLFRLGANLSGEDFDLDARTNEVLAPVHNPLDGGNDKDDSKGSNTVVYDEHQVSFISGNGIRKGPTYSCCYQWQELKGGRGRGWW